MKKIIFPLFLFLLATTAVFAQERRSTKFITLDKSTQKTLQSAEQLIKEKLQLSSDDGLVKTNSTIDKLGFTHEKYQQYFQGVKVEFGTYNVHAKNGSIQTMNGELFSAGKLNVSPSISNQTGLQKALTHVGAEKYLWETQNPFGYKKPQGELVVLPAIKGVTNTSALVYKYDIYAETPLYRADVYVDAHTGAVLFENNKIHVADTPSTGTSLYNGTVSFTSDSFGGSFRLRQTADGNGIQTFDMNNGTSYANASEVTSNSSSFTNAATAVQAHWGAEKTHKYFLQNHNRNSFDNAGGIIKSYVSYSSNYVNAYWNGSVMTYGDGDGVSYGPLVSLDIVGHEITHGVTERSANLVYSNESGALNESFSDIFGESIEAFAQANNDWLMGEQIGAGGSGGALRSMSNPNAFGDPDTYQGTNWATGTADNGGVHTNSGVQNFWYYVLSVGKSGTNDNGDAYTVNGLGMDKAGKIAYRNLTVYLSANSTYADARTGAIQAAVDLYGAGSAEEIATTNAWYAVGVGAAYNTGTPPPATCYTGNINLSITFDNYPEETGWTLKDANGITLDSASYSTANPDGSTVTRTFNGLAAGSYTFTITDSYGDGMCCSYGNGSYSLSNSTGTFKTGGSFTSSEATTFCIDAGTADTTAPVITLTGAATINLNVGDTYNEQGATATDNVDGDISANVVIGGDTVNTNAASTYVVTYNVSDAAGNAATQVTRTVIVTAVADTTAPVITLTGAATINLNVGDTYNEQGVTATDNVDGDISANVVIGGDTVNTNVAGTYVVTYNVSDAAGNAAIQVTRTVNVTAVADTTTPVITLTGAATINLNVGDTYNEQGATATDNVDGDISANVVIGGDTVNTNVAGTYVVTYNVSDAAGNAATQVTRTVNVTTVSTGGCTNGIASFPYNEGFENTLGAWSQATGDDFDWTVDANGTPSSNTGPSSASQGTYYVYMESSSPNYSTKRAILNSPCFDLSTETQATFAFKYHMYGATAMGSLALEASTDNGVSWTSIWNKSGNQGNAWLSASVDLAAYVGGTVQLRFNGVTGTTWQGDMAIDAVGLTTGGGTGGGSCSDVSLSITFDNYPSETSWEVKDSAGTIVASGGTYGSQANGSTLNVAVGCLPDGCYDFIMKDSYGDGMCCSYGNGSYSLTNATGTVLASGGSFTSTDTTNFCLTAGAVAGFGESIQNQAVSESNGEFNVTLYPNPVKGDILNIRTSVQNVGYAITNMMGQLVSKGQITNNMIDVNNLQSGMYILELTSDSNSVTKKFIKK